MDACRITEFTHTVHDQVKTVIITRCNTAQVMYLDITFTSRDRNSNRLLGSIE